MTHDEKYKEFSRLIAEADKNEIDVVVIAYPQVIGDNYEEIVENLGKIADAGLSLCIAGRKNA